ncbi:MAG: 5'-nucleotidase C-terminal domain-containing protein [Ignavibacteriaceae bacterium]|nr:5'-nucleotidase C-terminal domain-containing protein [Ignavibacteriaceae bacterium]
MKKLLSLIIVLLISLSVYGQQTDTLTILYLNDTHSCLAPLAPRTPDLQGTQGGIARAASVIGMTQMSEPNVLTLHGGDFFIGDLFFNKFLGVAELQILNSLGLDAMGVGNHEFDLTPYVLKTALDSSSIQYPLVSSNIFFGDSTVAGLGNYIQPYKVIQKGTVKAGIIGLTTPSANLLSLPAPVIIDTTMDGLMAAKDSLTAAGCDIIILLSHMGIALDKTIAAGIPGIDIILSAHDHMMTAEPVVINNAYTGKPVYIIQSDSYYRYIGKMKVILGANGVQNVDFANIKLDATIPPEPQTEAVVNSLIADIEQTYGPMYTQQIASATAKFDELITPPFLPNMNYDTPVGNLVTDAMRAATGTQIAITTGGFTSMPVEAGPVVPADIYRAIGYGFNETNTLGFRLATFTLTGADILTALNATVLAAMGEVNDEFLPQVSGMKFGIDLNLPGGYPVSPDNVFVGNAPLDPGAMYTVTANEALVAALGLFQITPSGVVISDSLTEFTVTIAYITGQGSISPVRQGRVTQNDDKNIIPADFELKQNYPNPFNPSTRIEFRTGSAGRVTLQVFNTIGELTATILDDYLSSGTHTITWNAGSLPGGVYFIRLISSDYSFTIKALLLK